MGRYREIELDGDDYESRRGRPRKYDGIYRTTILIPEPYKRLLKQLAVDHEKTVSRVILDALKAQHDKEFTEIHQALYGHAPDFNEPGWG